MNSQIKLGIGTALLWIGLLFPSSAATPVDPKVLHLLNRLSFGPRPGDLQKVEVMGRDRYIQQQLSPDSISESPELTAKLNQLPSLNMTQIALLQQFRPRAVNGQKPDEAAKQAARRQTRVTLQDAVEARLLRATESNRQLQEVMVDFWFNHFNVYSGKGLTRAWVGSYEQEAIRPHVMGRFRDLLEATARHPAMLFYLDNIQNSAANNPAARPRSQGLNENYARELMELHTLGVNGGYTQQDVISLAKILTGWGYRRVGQAQFSPLPAEQSGNIFYFDEKRHDFSDKVFLGHKIKGGGASEVEQALDILAKHPATAKHITYELAQYFVADHPPKALVDRLAQRYLATDGNIREVLVTLFRSPEFNDSKYFNVKFKTPYQYVVSAYRAMGLSIDNAQRVQNTLQQLGMPIYGCQTPDGYKNTQDAWLNPDAMTRRLSFATQLAQGHWVASNDTSSTTSLPAPAINAIQLMQTLGDRFSPQTRQAIATSFPQLQTALVLGSPDFMKR